MTHAPDKSRLADRSEWIAVSDQPDLCDNSQILLAIPIYVDPYDESRGWRYIYEVAVFGCDEECTSLSTNSGNPFDWDWFDADFYSLLEK